MARTALGLLLAGLLAGAQDLKTLQQEFARKKAEVCSFLAAEHAKLGSELESKKLGAWAYSEFCAALFLNRDDKTARERLGVGGKEPRTWKNENADEKQVAAALQGYQKKRDTLQKTAISRLRALAKWCRDNKLAEEARSVFALLMFYDNEDLAWAEALGWSLHNGRWYSKDELAWLEKLRNWKGRKVEAKLVETEKWTWEPKTEMAWAPKHDGYAKVTSDIYETDYLWCRVHGGAEGMDSITREEIDDRIRCAEHCYFMYVEAFGLKPGFQDEEIASCGPGNDWKWELKKPHRPLKGTQKKIWFETGARWKGWSADREYYHAALCVFFHTMEGHFRGEVPWIIEGMERWFMTSMFGRDYIAWRTRLPGSSTQAERDYRPGDPKTWARQVRQLVEGRQDPALRDVMFCWDSNALDTARTLKAWSLWDFLFTDHRLKFGELLWKLGRNPEILKRIGDHHRKCRGACGAGPDGTVVRPSLCFESNWFDQKMLAIETMLPEVFGWTLEELDARWRAFVRQRYWIK